jgi:hypothetical protein
MIVIGSAALSAQGLDWQYSLRTPVESPTRFLGLQLAAGPALHNGELPYLQSDLGLECCRYTSGDGISYSGELMGEFWLTGSLAVAATVGYLQRGSNWVTDGDTLPRRDGSVVITEYDFDNTLRYATLGGTARLRMGRTNLTLGIGLRLGILLGTTSTQLERVVSPDSYTFPTNPPSKEVVLNSSPVEDANSVVVIPSVRVAWDIAIGRGMYVTPFAGVQLPLTTVASSADWRVTELSLGLALMRSF